MGGISNFNPQSVNLTRFQSKWYVLQRMHPQNLAIESLPKASHTSKLERWRDGIKSGYVFCSKSIELPAYMNWCWSRLEAEVWCQSGQLDRRALRWRWDPGCWDQFLGIKPLRIPDFLGFLEPRQKLEPLEVWEGRWSINQGQKNTRSCIYKRFYEQRKHVSEQCYATNGPLREEVQSLETWASSPSFFFCPQVPVRVINKINDCPDSSSVREMIPTSDGKKSF